MIFKYLFVIYLIMISKSVLGTIAKDQRKEFSALEDSVSRSILSNIMAYKGMAAFVIKGLRRCGKSTLMKQLVK